MKLTKTQQYVLAAFVIVAVIIGGNLLSTTGSIGGLTKCLNGQCGLPQGESVRFGALEMVSVSKMLHGVGYTKFPVTYTMQLYDPSGNLVTSKTYNYVVARYDSGNTVTYYNADGTTYASKPFIDYTLPATAKTGTWVVKDKAFSGITPIPYGTTPTSFPSAAGGAGTLDVTDTSTYFSFNVIEKTNAASLGYQCTIDDRPACVDGNIRSCNLVDGTWKTTICPSSASCKLVNMVPTCSVGCTLNAVRCVDSTHFQRCTADAASGTLYWSGSITLLNQVRLDNTYVNKQVCSGDALVYQKVSDPIATPSTPSGPLCGEMQLTSEGQAALYSYIKEMQFAYSNYQVPQTDASVQAYLTSAGLTTASKLCSTLPMLLEVKTVNGCPVCTVKTDVTASFETCSDGSRRPAGTCPTPVAPTPQPQETPTTPTQTAPEGTPTPENQSVVDQIGSLFSGKSNCMTQDGTIVKYGACNAANQRCGESDSKPAFIPDTTCATSPDVPPESAGGVGGDTMGVIYLVGGIGVVLTVVYFATKKRRK